MTNQSGSGDLLPGGESSTESTSIDPLGRRRFMVKAAMAGGAVWAAPTLLSAGPAAAASLTSPPPSSTTIYTQPATETTGTTTQPGGGTSQPTGTTQPDGFTPTPGGGFTPPGGGTRPTTTTRPNRTTTTEVEVRAAAVGKPTGETDELATGDLRSPRGAIRNTAVRRGKVNRPSNLVRGFNDLPTTGADLGYLTTAGASALITGSFIKYWSHQNPTTESGPAVRVQSPIETDKD